MSMNRILVIGAAGRIGSELVPFLAGKSSRTSWPRARAARPCAPSA